jgi:hypothetical protein
VLSLDGYILSWDGIRLRYIGVGYMSILPLDTRIDLWVMNGDILLLCLLSLGKMVHNALFSSLLLFC